MISCRTFYGKTKEIPESEFVLRVSVYGFITHDEKLLVMHLPETGKLSVPGGGIESGEAISDALRREVSEETSLYVELGKLVTLDEDFFYYDPSQEAWHGILLFYECELLSGDPDKLQHTNTGEGHVEEPQWRELASLKLEQFVPPVAQALETWLASKS